jgi:phospholipid/cholesterol/gamma-HCH transport system ATP-binding protein
MQASPEQFAIRVSDLVVGFRQQTGIDHLSPDVRRDEIVGLVGASGGGKSVLMRTIIGLIQNGWPYQSWASISTNLGRDVLPPAMWGILFQQGAVFPL